MKITTMFAGLVIGSMAYHLNADDELTMGIPSYQVSWMSMGLGSLTGAFLFSTFSKEKTSKVAWLLFVGIFLSIVGRMVYDSCFTSRDHHLAPLELIIYCILSLPAAFAGAYLGKLITRWKKN